MIQYEKNVLLGIVNLIRVVLFFFCFGNLNVEYVLSEVFFISVVDVCFEKKSENKRKIEFIVNVIVNFIKVCLMCEK